MRRGSRSNVAGRGRTLVGKFCCVMQVKGGHQTREPGIRPREMQTSHESEHKGLKGFSHWETSGRFLG